MDRDPSPCAIPGFKKHRFWVFYLVSWLIILLVAAVRTLYPRDFWQLVGEAQEQLQVVDLNIWSIARMMSLDPILGLIFVYALAPTISAFLVLKLSGDREGMRDWISRLHPLRGTSLKRGARWYGALLASYLAMVIVFGAATTFLSDETSGNPLTAGLSEPTLLTSTAKAAFIDEGAMLEEMGWRGYGYPLLLSRMGPTQASAVLGALWGLWHIPSQLGSPFYSLDTAFLSFQVVFVLYSIALTVLTVFFVNKIGGSVWPAILVHGFGNYTGIAATGTVLGVQSGFFWKTVLMLVLSAALVIATRGRLGLPSPDVMGSSERS